MQGSLEENRSILIDSFLTMKIVLSHVIFALESQKIQCQVMSACHAM